MPTHTDAIIQLDVTAQHIVTVRLDCGGCGEVYETRFHLAHLAVLAGALTDLARQLGIPGEATFVGRLPHDSTPH